MGRVHLGFPMALECCKGDVKEGTFEVFAISSAKIEYCRCDRDTQFLNFIRSLKVNFVVYRETFFMLASSRQSVGSPTH
jgi:hypothetical protein